MESSVLQAVAVDGRIGKTAAVVLGCSVAVVLDFAVGVVVGTVLGSYCAYPGLVVLVLLVATDIGNLRYIDIGLK